MVYELYLKEEVKAAGCKLLKHLTNLPDIAPLLEGVSRSDGGGKSGAENHPLTPASGGQEKALQTIEKACKELSDPTHPVSVAMAKMQEIPEVKLIEGKKWHMTQTELLKNPVKQTEIKKFERQTDEMVYKFTALPIKK